MTNPQASIIIPAYNEERLIRVILESVVGQKTNRPFEVIVVDNASTDNTAAEARKFADRLNIRVITENRKGRGRARHTGFAAAKGEFLLSTDADAWLPPDWLEVAVTYLENAPQDVPKPIVAVTAPSYIDDAAEFTNRFINWLQPFSMHLYRSIYGHYWMSGFSSGVRRSAYEKTPGFDPDLNTYEDVDVAVKVAKVGRILYVPEMKIKFSGRRFWGGPIGLIRGVLEYLLPFFAWKYLHKKSVDLSDIR